MQKRDNLKTFVWVLHVHYKSSTYIDKWYYDSREEARESRKYVMSLNPSDITRMIGPFKYVKTK